MSYEKVSQVEMSGQFAVRGEILDIFPMTEDTPVRIDLWDDEIDSIKYFDVDSQRSIENINEITIYPATEYILDKEMINNGVKAINKEMVKVEKKFREAMKTEEAHRIKTIVKEFTEQLELGNINVAIDSFINYFYSEMSSLIEYLEDKDVIYIFDEPSRLTDRSETIEKEFRESMSNRLEKGYILPGQADVMHTYGQLLAMTSDKQRIVFTTLSQKIRNIDIKETFHIEAKNIVSYNSSFELLIKDLKDYRKRATRF